MSLVLGMTSIPATLLLSWAADVSLPPWASVWAAQRLIFLGFVMSPSVGLVIGSAALLRSWTRPSQYGGRGKAIAGTLSCALSLLPALFIAALWLQVDRQGRKARAAVQVGMDVVTAVELSEAAESAAPYSAVCYDSSGGRVFKTQCYGRSCWVESRDAKSSFSATGVRAEWLTALEGTSRKDCRRLVISLSSRIGYGFTAEVDGLGRVTQVGPGSHFSHD